MKIDQTYIQTPLGEMLACATPQGICLLEFTNRKNLDKQIGKLTKELNASIETGKNPIFDLLRNELRLYFDRKLQSFTVPLDLVGSEFQKRVWHTLLTIPYGATISYLEQAQRMGNQLAVRAVANANGMNKIPIIIPCHRVIGSDGKLTGYAGGLERKRWLLELESRYQI